MRMTSPGNNISNIWKNPSETPKIMFKKNKQKHYIIISDNLHTLWNVALLIFALASYFKRRAIFL